MASPLKTPKINHGGNQTTMEDLDDYMLNQILLRLPNCATVLSCNLVNKRWCSLMSNPDFPVQFDNHKKKTTLLKGSGFSHEDDEPQWTFIATMKSCGKPFITKFIIGSPKLTLEFLPVDNCTTRTTFKDLVLCDRTDEGGRRVYYITNPLTKQWVTLPPHPRQWNQIKSAFLICQPPYNHTRDYKFRVVEIKSAFLIYTFDLFVYCSESGEWKETKLRVPKEVGRLLEVSTAKPEYVLCNGSIYFRIGLCLVGLDPFDVNDTSDTTLEARVMPQLPGFGHLHESSGKLLVIHTPGRQRGIPCFYKKDGRDIRLELEVWKLDPNQAPLAWETSFRGLCKGTWNSIELPYNITRLGYIYANDIGVHPYNDKLIYICLSHENHLVLCNTRTGCITPSKSLPNNLNLRFHHRLEQQWWPTSVPSLVQRVTVE